MCETTTERIETEETAGEYRVVDRYEEDYEGVERYYTLYYQGDENSILWFSIVIKTAEQQRFDK